MSVNHCFLMRPKLRLSFRATFKYYRLLDAGFDVWMDKINLLPGQRWQQEIPQAIRHSDFILIFFSKRSVAKRGYIQREFRLALDTGFPEQAYRKRRSVRQWVK